MPVLELSEEEAAYVQGVRESISGGYYHPIFEASRDSEKLWSADNVGAFAEDLTDQLGVLTQQLAWLRMVEAVAATDGPQSLADLNRRGLVSVWERMFGEYADSFLPDMRAFLDEQSFEEGD